MSRSIHSPASPLASLFVGCGLGGDSPAAGIQPGSQLAEPPLDGRPGQLVLLTGPSGSGKSTYCVLLAEQARAAGLMVAGLIAHPVIKAGCKVAIELEELLAGERCALATRRRRGDEGLITEQWRFMPGAFDWADHILRDLPACDVLIIDEIGPLELLRAEGMQRALGLLDDRNVPLSFAVVRPSLLSLALQRWPWATVLQVLPKEWAGA